MAHIPRDRLEALTCRLVVDGRRVPRSPEVIRWLFWRETVPEPVGRFTYFDINPRNRSAEFGYFVQPQYRNQGMGTAMLTIAFTHLFTTTDFHKLYCQTGAFNAPSIRLLEKLGLHRDGILREHHELDGVLWDDYVYSLLRREWQDPGATGLTFTVATEKGQKFS